VKFIHAFQCHQLLHFDGSVSVIKSADEIAYLFLELALLGLALVDADRSYLPLSFFVLGNLASQMLKCRFIKKSILNVSFRFVDTALEEIRWFLCWHCVQS
jgi:hypothetical protein